MRKLVSSHANCLSFCTSFHCEWFHVKLTVGLSIYFLVYGHLQGESFMWSREFCHYIFWSRLHLAFISFNCCLLFPRSTYLIACRSREGIWYRSNQFDFRCREHPCNCKQWSRSTWAFLWGVPEDKCIRRSCSRNFPPERGTHIDELAGHLHQQPQTWLTLIITKTLLHFVSASSRFRRWMSVESIVLPVSYLKLNDNLWCQVPIQSVKEHLLKEGIEVRIWGKTRELQRSSSMRLRVWVGRTVLVLSIFLFPTCELTLDLVHQPNSINLASIS